MKNIASLLSLVLSLIAVCALTNCNLDQPIDLQLPPYEKRIFVEAYLEVGRPFGVLLTKSSSYFAPFNLAGNDLLNDLLENDARVIIRQGSKVYELKNKLSQDPFTGKFFNYFLNFPVPNNFIDSFELEITTAAGDLITSTAKLLRPVPIDSIIVEYNPEDKLKARVLTYFTDESNEVNYYRRMLHESALDSVAFQDFTTSDRVFEGAVVFGTRYAFEKGDTIINTLFHISEDYYNFLESVQGAIQANGNPFAQPSPIISNIKSDINAFGIFTTLSYERKRTILQ